MSKDPMKLIEAYQSIHAVKDCECCSHSWKMLAKVARALEAEADKRCDHLAPGVPVFVNEPLTVKGRRRKVVMEEFALTIIEIGAIMMVLGIMLGIFLAAHN